MGPVGMGGAVKGESAWRPTTIAASAGLHAAVSLVPSSPWSIMVIRLLRFHCLCVLAVWLTACGGGGGSGSPPVQPPTLTVQPASVTVLDGAAASFSVTASGQAPLSYQWQKNGVDIPGATAASYSLAAAKLDDSGALFGVVVGNAGGKLSSQTATLTVRPMAPALDVQPTADSATAGTAFSFTAHATGSQPLAYQWYRAGIALPGATGSTLKLDAVAFADDGVAYMVEVSNAGGTAQSHAASLNVKPAGAATVVNACREFTVPGAYVLGRDITGANQVDGPCLHIHDVQGVQLDCAGHKLSRTVSTYNQVLKVTKVRDLSVKNCQMDVFTIELDETSYGSITRNTLVNTGDFGYATFNVWKGDHVVFDNNTVTGIYQQRVTVSSTVSNNTFGASSNFQVCCSVLSTDGAHTRILANTIDGGWDGRPQTGLNGTRTGADDGIVVSDEADLRIENNVIRNVWDCGIETLGLIAHSHFRGNRIVKGGLCGIGAWYWNSLLGNTFAENVVERSGSLFELTRAYGLRAASVEFGQDLPADTLVYFKDNVFEGNKLIDPMPYSVLPSFAARMPVFDRLLYTNQVSTLPGERAAPADSFQIENNVFRNNRFGTLAYAPWFGEGPVVPGMVVDGGGNQCQPPFPVYKNYPLTCQP